MNEGPCFFDPSPYQERECVTSDDSDWTYVPVASDIPPYWYYTGEISKSPMDAAEYKIVRLVNGIEVLLCSDATTLVAGASVLFPVGTFDQPVGQGTSILIYT